MCALRVKRFGLMSAFHPLQTLAASRATLCNGNLALPHTSLEAAGVPPTMPVWTRTTGPILALVLCGCSVVPSQVRSQTVAPTYSTAKVPELFAECLAKAFGPVEAVRHGVRAAINSKSGLEIDLFDGGTVRVRRPAVLDGDTRRRLEACL